MSPVAPVHPAAHTREASARESSLIRVPAQARTSLTPLLAGLPTAVTAGPVDWRLGSLLISLGPHHCDCGPREGQVELLIPIGQPGGDRQGALQGGEPPQLELLFRSAEEESLQPLRFHGWRLQMDLERLCQLAGALSRHRISPMRLRRQLQGQRQLQLAGPAEQALATALLQLLQLSAHQLRLQQEPLELVGLDRAIQRLVLLLLCGDLIHSARRTSEEEAGSRARVMEELTLWIDANLHRPIQLQDLVQQSGYSQRSLRNFFQERFGCGPVRWIRSRRLQAARQRLLSPQPEDTVSSIAALYGYGHLSQFSRDFQLAHQVRPSQLLRQGMRACWGTAEGLKPEVDLD